MFWKGRINTNCKDDVVDTIPYWYSDLGCVISH